jgi:hypothetical protein
VFIDYGHNEPVVEKATALLTDDLALMLKEALVGHKVLLPACVCIAIKGQRATLGRSRASLE